MASDYNGLSFERHKNHHYSILTVSFVPLFDLDWSYRALADFTIGNKFFLTA